MSDNQDLDDTRCTPESDRENMRATIAALCAEVEKLTREKDALHDSFVRLAHADKRTPLGIDDAAMLEDIDGGDWIVPKEIAAAIARLEAEKAHECAKVAQRDREIEELQAEIAGLRMLNDPKDDPAIIACLDSVEKAGVLRGVLAAALVHARKANAENAALRERSEGLARECRAWREFDEELMYADSQRENQMMTVEDEKNVRAARNAARVARKTTDKAELLEGESDGN